MISRGLSLVLTVVLFCPSLLRAQEDTKACDPFKPYASSNAAMYEDIEIFRRILDRKLAPLRQQVHVGYLQLSGSDSDWTARIEDSPSSLEGVYLKGHGVVYTATLPSLQPAEQAGKIDWEIELKIPRPGSEWESVRRQLRNEKEEPKKPEATKPPALTDVLLKVLAENGHHFSQLGENESLTIVLTVRGANPSPTARTSENETKEERFPLPASSKVRDLELLGDLHMKQEHYGQARDAFRQAMELKPGRDKTAALARKLAQAYLLLGNIEEARGALNQALALIKDAADKKDKPAPRAKPSSELPVKLIISAPKKLLDQVKEGKITFEEFLAKAHVETLRFAKRP
ncbi:MAG TPA: tetratricopeptide repeat protein [Gemmataceae bacterium]|nr:tetratricopeptide repeat protein [Gemmataceae bacterium]